MAMVVMKTGRFRKDFIRRQNSGSHSELSISGQNHLKGKSIMQELEPTEVSSSEIQSPWAELSQPVKEEDIQSLFGPTDEVGAEALSGRGFHLPSRLGEPARVLETPP